MTADPRSYRGWSGGRDALVQTASEVLTGFGLPTARNGLEQMVQIGLAGERGADGGYGYEQLLRLVVGRILREGGMEDRAIERLFAASGPAVLEEMLLEPPGDAAPAAPAASAVPTAPSGPAMPPSTRPALTTSPASAAAPTAPRTAAERRAEPPLAARPPVVPPSPAPVATPDRLAQEHQEQARVRAETEAMRATLEELRARGARLAERHSAAEADLAFLREASEGARRARDAALAARDALEAEAAALDQALAQARAELAQARDQLREARAELDAIDAQRDRIARFVARATDIRDRLQASPDGPPST